MKPELDAIRQHMFEMCKEHWKIVRDTYQVTPQEFDNLISCLTVMVFKKELDIVTDTSTLLEEIILDLDEMSSNEVKLKLLELNRSLKMFSSVSDEDITGMISEVVGDLLRETIAN